MLYPVWIDRYTKATAQLFTGQVLEGFQPLDFFRFFPLWYDLFLERIDGALAALDEKKIPFEEQIVYLPTPSSLRAMLVKIVSTFPVLERKDEGAYRRVVSFFVRALHHLVPSDPFAEKSSPDVRYAHYATTETPPLLTAEEGCGGKMIGRLILGLGHLVNGLYNDVVTDMGWDAYGPYPIPRYGKDAVLLIRDFPNLVPKELWPTNDQWLSKKSVRIFSVYRGVVVELRGVGCHTWSEAPLDRALVSWAIEADGTMLSREGAKALVAEALILAGAHYERVQALTLEERKQKALLQECYQLYRFFAYAGMDWRPTPEMQKRATSPLRIGLIPHGRLLTPREYEKFFGIGMLRGLFRTP